MASLAGSAIVQGTRPDQHHLDIHGQRKLWRRHTSRNTTINKSPSWNWYKKYWTQQLSIDVHTSRLQRSFLSGIKYPRKIFSSLCSKSTTLQSRQFLPMCESAATSCKCLLKARQHFRCQLSTSLANVPGGQETSQSSHQDCSMLMIAGQAFSILS